MSSKSRYIYIYARENCMGQYSPSVRVSTDSRLLRHIYLSTNSWFFSQADINMQTCTDICKHIHSQQTVTMKSHILKQTYRCNTHTNLYSVLSYIISNMLIFRHEWHIAYRLTAIRSSGLLFNGRHPRNLCNYMDHHSFTDPGGMEG